jgi:hypothetical protein
VSLANVRKHWRFLATTALIFVALAAAGPLIFYGSGPLFEWVFDSPGLGFVLIFGTIFAVAVLGWIVFVPWAGDKADHLTLDHVSNDACDHADG